MHDFDSMLVIWKQKNVNFENTVVRRETWDSLKRPHRKDLSEKYKHSIWNVSGASNLWPYRLTIGFYNIDFA